MIRWIDIGFNLFNRAYPDPEKTLKQALEAGVYCILTASDAQESEIINEFIYGHDARGTAGIHPHQAKEACNDDYQRIRHLVHTNPRIVAVGECGLDYDRMFSAREQQLSCLLRQIEIAEEEKMPLFLHERCAGDDFLRVFDQHPALCRRSVIHCFTEGPEFLKEVLGRGFMIGITGWICDERRAEPLRRAVQNLPKERVMLETDAPYLTPRGVPGLARTNIPQNIRFVAQALAKFMEIQPSELEAAALHNTLEFFGINPSEIG